MRLALDIAAQLRCPVCRAELNLVDEELHCASTPCARVFPILHDAPILIHEENSVFQIDDYRQRAKTYFAPKTNESLSPWRKLRRWLSRNCVPSIDNNPVSARNFAELARELLAFAPAPRVLVIGGSVAGQGLQGFMQSGQVQFVETDVSLSPRVQVICDAHDLPFADETFDGVIVQAVLEHVIDPGRCVAEVHRVLKRSGIVYAETPFIQQVHGGAYDFTRFTPLGHRRLFRHFQEIHSGAACGPGMALAWSYKYFLNAFTTPRTPNIIKTFLNLWAHYTSFWLKYLDHWLIDMPGTLDAASGVFFLGRKAEQPLADRELIRQYRGNIV